MTQGHSVYEAWVLALRQWAQDSTYSLRDLPTLTATSFTPATFQRLITHLEKAISDMMVHWDKQLGAAIRAASDPHELARVMVDARRGYARRVQLASHPGLPEEIRAALVADAERSIRSIQRDLEDAVQRDDSRGRTSREESEKLLKIVRENSLERAMAMDVSGDEPVAPVRSAPPPARMEQYPIGRRWASRVIPPQ